MRKNRSKQENHTNMKHDNTDTEQILLEQSFWTHGTPANVEWCAN